MAHPDRLSQLLDEGEACRLVVDFYACLDLGDAQGCAACFAPDGVWERDAGPVAGREAIAAAVAGRGPSRRTVHTVLNPRFSPESAQRATLRFTLVAYDAVVSEPAAVPVGRMAGIRRCTDTLERLDGAWRIRHRTSTASLRGQ